eukprot:366569-Chlamydomonas_euryale.AAC.23
MLPMQHNPYEIGQPWSPPGGLYRARHCASSFFCPPSRSKPQNFVNFLNMPLHIQILCWPRPWPSVTDVTTWGMMMIDFTTATPSH